MRIAIDCRSVFDGMGGIGRYCACIVNALATLDGGNEYFLFLTDRPQSELRRLPGNMHVVTYQAGMIDENWEQFQLPSELDAMEIGVYHSTCFALPIIRGERQYIATIHDVVFDEHPEWVDDRLRRHLSRWSAYAAGVADAIVTVSEFSRARIAARYGVPGDTITVLPNGVSPEFRPIKDAACREEVRKHYGLPESFLLYVGSLEVKKGIRVLLTAYRQCLDDGLELPLVLVGGSGGQGYDVAKDIEELSLSEHVMRVGRVPDVHLPVLYAMATCFAFPSLYEGFGFTPLEAMACGAPTVVSDSTSLPEVVGEAAVIVPAGDSRALADALSKVGSDPELRAELSKKGPRQAAKFSWDRAAKGLLQLYERIAHVSD